MSSRTRSAATTLSHIKRRPIGKVGLYFTFHQQLTRFLIGPTWPPCKGVSGRPRTSRRLGRRTRLAWRYAAESGSNSSTSSSGIPALVSVIGPDCGISYRIADASPRTSRRGLLESISSRRMESSSAESRRCWCRLRRTPNSATCLYWTLAGSVSLNTDRSLKCSLKILAQGLN